MPRCGHYLGRVGRFIVFEGGEAVGKSTQAALLADRLGALLTREPGGTAVGEALRRLLLDLPLAPVPKVEALLMLAARAQHVAEVIDPALARGEDVVCDRYSGSTLAYQGFGRGLPLDELQKMNSWATGGRAPDVIVLLDLPMADARHRLSSSRPDRIEAEGEEFLDRAQAGFRQLAAADPLRWRVVDAAGSVEEVAERVWKAVDEARNSRLDQAGEPSPSDLPERKN
jgi:dTMP kinase